MSYVTDAVEAARRAIDGVAVPSQTPASFASDPTIDDQGDVVDAGATTEAAAPEPTEPVAAEPTEPVAAEPVAEPEQTEAPAEVSEQTATEVEEAATEVVQQIFDLDMESIDWDTVSVSDKEALLNVLPEYLHPFAEKLMGMASSHFESEYKSRTEEAETAAEQWRRMYQAMANGEVDPRIAELESANKTIAGTVADWQAQAAQAQEAAKAEIQAQVDREATWFKHVYGDRFSTAEDNPHREANAERKSLLLDLYEAMPEGSMLVAAEVALMGPVAVTKAKSLMARGVPESALIDILQPQFSARSNSPSPAAAVVGGATGGGGNPPPPTPPSIRSMAPDDARLAAAQKAIEKAMRKRR